MERFLEDLFGDELTPDRRIAVFTTPDRQTRFFHDLGQLGLYARQRSSTQNVYFGVGLIRGEPKGRGKYDDIAGIGALWCDIDVRSPAHPKGNLPESVEEANGILSVMPLPPSISVHSGHGLHAYWLLHEPWIFQDDEERKCAASLAKGWHGRVCALAGKQGWALENLGDLTRVLRLPDTLNHNGLDDPVEVQILQSESGCRYAADDFQQFLPDEEPSEAATKAQIGPLVLDIDAEPPAVKLLETASQSPLFWQTWNRQRDDLPDQSQSGYDLSLATIAMLNNWNDQEVANLIITARRHHGQKPEKAMREDYIRGTIGRARQSVSSTASDDEAVDLSRLLSGAVAGASSPAESSGPEAITRRLHDVERETVEWLWPGRVPLGKLTLLAGDPGLGKSLVSLDMAARVSRGHPWPDLPLLPQPAGAVILLNAEDDLADTIAPRLDRAEADDSKIIAIEGVEVRNPKKDETLRWYFSLENDLPRLAEVIVDTPDVRLIVIDPISAYCGKVDSHKNADVRSLLAPLAELASRHRVAIVAITHLSKTGGNKAVYRAMGSLAFAAAARAVWAVIKEQTDPQRRLFLPAKLNLAEDPDGLAYRIVKGGVEWEADPVRMHADDAFAAEAAAAEKRPTRRGSERREAVEWLREHLAEGPAPASEAIELGGQFGFSERTLRRAYKEIGTKPKKESFDGPWLWGLAGQDVHDATSV